jgi:AcrR family transcriptional regulator
MKEKSDRRVLYTKMVLKDAITNMLKDHHISKISVKSLCEAADINRSTFYSHYTDQFDLLRQVEGEVIDNLKKHLEAYEGGQMPITEGNLNAILEYAKDNSDLFIVLLGENCDRNFRKILMEVVDLVPFQYKAEGRQKGYIIDFAVTGCISILHKWLSDGAEESPGEMSSLILKIIYNGLLGF